MDDDRRAFLTELLTTPSPSGYEVVGQRVWVDYVREFADDVWTDDYGNAVAVHEGGADASIAFGGHADEIGYIVRDITDDGFLRISRIGGADRTVSKGQHVTVHAETPVAGVIGQTAIHLRDGNGDDTPEIAEQHVDIGVDDVTTAEGLERAYDLIDSRFELLGDLLEADYDYVHLTVFAVNALQHKYGDGEETARAWELIDDRLGRIDTEETLLVLYSDHGHSRIDHTFAVNRWLLDNGYLSLSADASAGSSLGTALSEKAYTTLESLGISPKQASVYARRILPSPLYDAIVPASFPISSAELASEVDWSETDALAFSQGPLYLNRRRLGDRYEAVREELRRELSELTHRGSTVLSDVRPAEAVYDGPFVADAPDLLLSSSEGWEIYGGITPSPFESQVMSWTSGNHPLGVLLLNGPGVEQGELSECSILDVAPTVLSYLDSPIPTDMDGYPLETAFSDGTLSVTERDPIEVESTRGNAVEDGLRDQLEDLGYLE